MVGTVGWPIKIVCRAWHLTNFLKCPGFVWEFAQGKEMLVAGIDLHIILY